MLTNPGEVWNKSIMRSSALCRETGKRDFASPGENSRASSHSPRSKPYLLEQVGPILDTRWLPKPCGRGASGAAFVESPLLLNKWRPPHGIIFSHAPQDSWVPRLGRQTAVWSDCVGALQIKPRNSAGVTPLPLACFHRGGYPLPDAAQLCLEGRPSWGVFGRSGTARC